MSVHTQKSSITVRAEIAARQVSAREARLERWRLITQDRAAEFLADLVFVTLMLLLFLWFGLWTLVH